MCAAPSYSSEIEHNGIDPTCWSCNSNTCLARNVGHPCDDLNPLTYHDECQANGECTGLSAACVSCLDDSACGSVYDHIRRMRSGLWQWTESWQLVSCFDVKCIAIPLANKKCCTLVAAEGRPCIDFDGTSSQELVCLANATCGRRPPTVNVTSLYIPPIPCPNVTCPYFDHLVECVDSIDCIWRGSLGDCREYSCIEGMCDVGITNRGHACSRGVCNSVGMCMECGTPEQCVSLYSTDQCLVIVSISITYLQDGGVSTSLGIENAGNDTLCLLNNKTGRCVSGSCVQCTHASDCDITQCTTAICSNYVCQITSFTGSECVRPETSTLGYCNSYGVCTECIAQKDCAQQQCYETQCVNNVCTPTPSMFGVPCGSGVCNGEGICSGSLCTIVDGNITGCYGTLGECDIEFSCVNNTCGTIPQEANMPCGLAGHKFCDGNSRCVMCLSNTTCPISSNQCMLSVCRDNSCGYSPAPARTQCSIDGGSICDGAGSCVACIIDNDCEAVPCGENTCSVNGQCVLSLFQAEHPCTNQGFSGVCAPSGNCTECVSSDNCFVRLGSLSGTCWQYACINTLCAYLPAPKYTVCENGLCWENSTCVIGNCLDDSNCAALSTPDCVSVYVCGPLHMCVPVYSNYSSPCSLGLCNGNGTCIVGDCLEDSACVGTPADCHDSPQCINYQCTSAYSASGSTCRLSAGVCDGGGTCVNCTISSHCGLATECLSYTCDNNTCTIHLHAGTACHRVGDIVGVCNGADRCVECIMNSNCVPHGECYSKSCLDGECTYSALGYGSLCTGGLCDGTGSCISGNCLDSLMCSQNTQPCITQIDCINHTCTPIPSDAATLCGNGEKVCDGSGNCVNCLFESDCDRVSAPPDCHMWQCVSNVCQNIMLPVDTSCPTGKCNEKGQCHGCLSSSECPATSCQIASCTAGICGITQVAFGNACVNGETGVCNSTGGCVECVIAADCSPSKCQDASCSVAGKCALISRYTGSKCTDNSGVCTSAGECVSCLSSSDCTTILPSCRTPKCDPFTHSCGSQMAPFNSTCATGYCNATGICVQCTQASTCSATICQIATCSATGACVVTNKDLGTSCSTANTSMCSKAGQCLLVLPCADPSDCPPQYVCSITKVCVMLTREEVASHNWYKINDWWGIAYNVVWNMSLALHHSAVAYSSVFGKAIGFDVTSQLVAQHGNVYDSMIAAYALGNLRCIGPSDCTPTLNCAYSTTCVNGVCGYNTSGPANVYTPCRYNGISPGVCKADGTCKASCSSHAECVFTTGVPCKTGVCNTYYLVSSSSARRCNYTTLPKNTACSPSINTGGAGKCTFTGDCIT
jgi:hypothetical protein